MKITIEFDDGKSATYNDVSDMYLAIRTLRPVGMKTMNLTLLPETQSFSWGGNLRELVKEITQSLDELQDILREQRNGHSSERGRGMAKHSG